MRFGSVCSGIEAASVAWAPLGWKAAWFSEIEPFPCEVLKHHFPDVTNMGDMTLLPERIASGEVEPPEMLCGGTPCQAFSYAGKRLSLDDYRGNLTLTFCEIADSIDHVRTICGDEPCIIFWENVPGVLSTKDNAFGCFLGQLVGADAPLSSGAKRWPSAGVVAGPKRKAAWRVLDAQHFGVPQRRRRVFVVASARERVDPAEILFERKGVCRDSEKGGGEGSGVAPAAHGRASCQDKGAVLSLDRASFNQGKNAQYEFSIIEGMAQTLTARGPSAVCYDMTHACDVIRESGSTTPTLQARMGTGGNQVPLVLSDNERIYNSHLSYGVVKEESVCKTLNAQMDNQTDMPLVLGGKDAASEGKATANVRRLTPVECERLQGFPDNWTLIPYRGKTEESCPDAPRYKAIGNSWAVPVVRWLGQRIKDRME